MRRINCILLTTAPEIKLGGNQCFGGRPFQRSEYYVLQEEAGAYYLLLKAEPDRPTRLFPWGLSQEVLAMLREYVYVAELESCYASILFETKPKLLTRLEFEELKAQYGMRQEVIVAELGSKAEINLVRNGVVEDLLATMEGQAKAEIVELGLAPDVPEVDWL